MMGTFVYGEFSEDVAAIAYLNRIRFTFLECFISTLLRLRKPEGMFDQPQWAPSHPHRIWVYHFLGGKCFRAGKERHAQVEAS